MPGGGGGRGRGGGGGRHRGGRRHRRRVRGFLKPCLLVILSREEGHGYSLLDQLGKFGFDSERSDPSLVYRALRDMEDAGWIESRWDDISQGPKRRVYQILPAGKAHLAGWVGDLRNVRDEISNLLQTYEEV